MDWTYRVMLLLVIVGIAAAAEGCIICWVYKLGRIDGWDAARSLYRGWRKSGSNVIVKPNVESMEC